MSINKKGYGYEQIKKSVYQSIDFGSNSETEDNPKVIDFNEEYDDGNKTDKPLSDIRKYNTALLNEKNNKYRGEIACRESFDSYHNPKYNFWAHLDAEFQDEHNKTLNCIDDFTSNRETEQTTKDTILLPKKNSKIELQKSVCVQNQLAIWEKLLEVRIHSQKILNKANNLPYPKEFQRIFPNEVYSESARETKKHLENLLEKLIETKFTLGMQFPEIKNLGLNEPNQYCNNKEYESLNKSNFEKFKPYRNSVLLKWEDRTNELGSYYSAKTRGRVEKLNIIKNIDNHLIKLNNIISKTRKIKAYYRHPQRPVDADRSNCTQQEISHVQIYDDTDFYHSQLRELIEYKTNISTNSDTQFLELQKLRQKMKKKVDTKASKGRKIRYIVHSKLINFMGSKSTSNWTEESKSELYKSLFLT